MDNQDAQDRKKQVEDISKKMQQMEVENMELFQTYGTTPQELLQLIRDDSKIPKALCALLQKQRQHLEETLARRIDEAASPYRKKETIFDARPGSHWIFVR